MCFYKGRTPLWKHTTVGRRTAGLSVYWHWSRHSRRNNFEFPLPEGDVKNPWPQITWHNNLRYRNIISLYIALHFISDNHFLSPLPESRLETSQANSRRFMVLLYQPSEIILIKSCCMIYFDICMGGTKSTINYTIHIIFIYCSGIWTYLDWGNA